MIAALAAAASAVAQPTLLLSIPVEHRLIEGVAIDGRTVWVSSVIDRKVLECRKACTVFATLPKGLHPMGMAWDRARQRLWIAADCPELPGVEKCERGALIALDRSGRIVAQHVPAGASFHPGDVSASSTGVFVGDSQNGSVYRLTDDKSELTLAVAAGVGKSAQGSAIDATGGKLVVADYSQGIGTVDLKTGGRTILTQEDGKPVRGIDGVARCGSTYYGIYNGGAIPPGLVRFTVTGDRISFERPFQGAPLSDPTQLAIDGEMMVLVGDAGWEGAAKDTARTAPATILAYDPPETCQN